MVPWFSGVAITAGSGASPSLGVEGNSGLNVSDSNGGLKHLQGGKGKGWKGWKGGGRDGENDAGGRGLLRG